MTKIVVFTWEEPEQGIVAEIWSLPENEWQLVQKVIEWIEEEWEGNVGIEIARTIICEPKTRITGAEIETIQDALQRLADGVRYTSGEGLYEEDCPQFKRYGIERS